MGEIASLQLIMLGLMYVLLAVAFRSYAQPLLIMTAIPFAFAGAVFRTPLAGRAVRTVLHVRHRGPQPASSSMTIWCWSIS